MITNEGYKRKTYQEILDGKIEKAKELFGEDIDVSDISPLGKYIRINAYDQAEAEEEAEMIYYSIFPDTAFGTSLDRLCSFVNISRNPAAASVYTVNVIGTANATIPIGFLVATDSEIQFYNTVATKLDTNGAGTLTVQCTQAGSIGNVNAADIKVIVNPDANVTSVLGSQCISVGTEAESDTALRIRFKAAKEGMGSCNEAAITAALMRVEGVTSAAVVVNNEDTTDSDGRPPHSFECYISGGTQKHSEIAETIFDKKPLGIKTHGTVSETIIDSGGNEHTIYFSHTTGVDISVLVKIKTNSDYEGNTGATNISDNLTSYINGLGVGKSVILSSLYGKIHAVAGVAEVTELKMSTDGGTTYTADNVAISNYQVANCTSVSVTVVT